MFRPLLAIAIIFIATPAFAAPPTEADIQQAIRELGDKQFAVREKASEFLWAAGPIAETALEEAARTQSGEIGRRARDILERLQWGLFADTPKAVADQIAEYRGGDSRARADAVEKLVAQGRPGYTAILRLANREDETDRGWIFDQACARSRPVLANFIRAGDFAGAEELFELCLLGESNAVRTDYAAFHFLRGTLPIAISKWQTAWTKTKSPLAAQTLIHLYRALGDFSSALKMAQNLQDDEWIDEILWEQEDWKALAQRPDRTARGDLGNLAARAAYQKRAGDQAAFNKSVAAIQTLGDSDDEFVVRSAALTLLLNGRVAEAMNLLADKKTSPLMLFELLREQTKFREAFAVARNTEALWETEQFSLDGLRARTMYDLGQKDQALQAYARLGVSLKEFDQYDSARKLLRSMVGRGLKDYAAEFFANHLAKRHTMLDGKDLVVVSHSLWEPLFGHRAESACVWFHFILERKKEDSAAKSIKTVQAMFAGKAVASCEEWAKELVASAEDRPRLSDLDSWQRATPPKPNLVTAAVAAGEVMAAAGNVRLANEYFAQAANATHTNSAAIIRYGDFLAENKRFREAAAVYAKATKLDPEMVLPVFLQGSALTQSGDAKEGQRLIELSHWLPLGNDWQRMRFSQELEKRGFIEDARRECDLVLSLCGYRHWSVGNVINQAVRLAVRQKDFAKAVALLDKGIVGCLRIGASFADPTAYLTMPEMIPQYRARLLLKEGRFDDALKLIRAGLDVLPGETEAAVEAVAALDAAGRKNDADELFAGMRDVYVRLSTEYPESAFVHHSLAWLCATCRRNLDAGLVHAQKAVKLEPADAKYLNTLAEVQFRRGEREKAIEAMKKCVAMEPKSGYYRKQLERLQKGDQSSALPERDDD